MATEAPVKGKPGRPKIVIDWELVLKLAHIQCTQAEIASTVDVSVFIFPLLPSRLSE